MKTGITAGVPAVREMDAVSPAGFHAVSPVIVTPFSAPRVFVFRKGAAGDEQDKETG